MVYLGRCYICYKKTEKQIQKLEERQFIGLHNWKVQELFDQLSEVDSLLNDFNRELSSYADDFEFSEEEFYEVENRLNEINRLHCLKQGIVSGGITCVKRYHQIYFFFFIVFLNIPL